MSVDKWNPEKGDATRAARDADTLLKFYGEHRVVEEVIREQPPCRSAVQQISSQTGAGRTPHNRHKPVVRRVWREAFPNAVCLVVHIARLVHNAEVIAIDGGSRRREETEERQKQHNAERRKRRGAGRQSNRGNDLCPASNPSQHRSRPPITSARHDGLQQMDAGSGQHQHPGGRMKL